MYKRQAADGSSAEVRYSHANYTCTSVSTDEMCIRDRRITMLTDSIYAREKAGQAHEFAIIYQTQEKDCLLSTSRCV